MTDFLLRPDADDLSQNSSYYGGTAPSSGTTNRLLIMESGVPVTKGLTTGLNLNQVVIGPNVRKKIGQNGEAMSISVNNGTDPKFIHMGAGGPAHALYLTGTIPQLEMGLAAQAFVTGGNLGADVVTVGGGCRLQVGSSAVLGASAGNTGTIRVQPGGVAVLDEYTGGTDRAGVVSVASGASLLTARTVADLTIAARGVAELLEAATISDGSSGGTCEMYGGLLRVRTRAGITIDSLTGLAGRLDPAGMGGALTISAGFVDRSSFDLPEMHSAGAVTFSGTEVGDPSMLNAILGS